MFCRRISCRIPKIAYRCTSSTWRPMSTRTGLGITRLSSPPSSILFVKKPRDSLVASALQDVVSLMSKRYPEVHLYQEPEEGMLSSLKAWSPKGERSPKIDLIVTLGGDGTILHASSLFKTGPIPPVLSFSMGTLGFLLPFDIDTFPEAIEEVFEGKASILERMRISCTFYRQDGSEIDRCGAQGWQVMNEVTLHRGSSPHLNIIDAFVDGQHLTEAVSDGLILSTPTGSTAYSLSSGGPIVHPSVHALVLTPICPRSLSFRSLVLPGSSRIILKINSASRAPASVAMDGQEAQILHPGEYLTVEASPHPVPCINRSTTAFASSNDVEKVRPGIAEPVAADDWVRDINRLLQFNASFKNKHLAMDR